MTAPRPGDAFHLDLYGTVIAGRYIEVDPPHRVVIGWDGHGTDKSTPTPALVEITLTPTGDGTKVKVELSGLSAEEAASYGNSGRVTLTGLQLPSLTPNRAHFLATESGTSRPTQRSATPGQLHATGRPRSGAEQCSCIGLHGACPMQCLSSAVLCRETAATLSRATA